MSASVGLPREPLIHIGYHKTGSTFLQRDVFTSDHGWWPFVPTRRIRNEILPSLTAFDWTPESIERRLETLLEPPSKPGLAAVLSSEDLSGFLFDGRRMARCYADLLYRLFPKGRILIVVREQRAMVRSVYGQFLAMGGTQPLRRFLQQADTPAHLPGFAIDQLRYHELAGYYQRKFGPDRVLVMPFERLVESAKDFVSAINAFGNAPDPGTIDAPPRKETLSMALAGLRRRVNWLIWHRDLNPAPLMHLPGLALRINRGLPRLGRRFPALDRLSTARMDREIARYCTGRFADSNQRLQEITGLDLARHHYEL